MQPHVFNFHWKRVFFSPAAPDAEFGLRPRSLPHSVRVISPLTFSPGSGRHPLYPAIGFRRSLSRAPSPGLLCLPAF